jgi:transposase
MIPARPDLFVGIDWAKEAHEVTVVEADGKILGRRSVEHGGAPIGEFIAWLLALAGGQPERIAVAIEMPRGALVEMLLDRSLVVYAINPKQLDRFRDRHTVAGAKDDRLDSYVLADSLRTDLHLFRRLKLEDPVTVELREFSRIYDDLQQDRSRLTSRLREQVYRYFPQMLRLCPAADEPWFWELLELIPTPAHARRARPAKVTALLKQHRIRRLTAEQILTELRMPPVKVGPGTVEAAQAHIRLLLPHLRLIQQQFKATEKQLEALLERMGASETAEGQKNEHRDAEIILSVPGFGIVNAATMLSEAAQALAERDLDQDRAHTGSAPVTRRSAKRKVVSRRYACNQRLANAMYHAARVHARCDPAARAHYAALRAKGHSHGRALRTIADRLLAVIIAMLRTGQLYDPSKRGRARRNEVAQAAG